MATPPAAFLAIDVASLLATRMSFRAASVVVAGLILLLLALMAVSVLVRARQLRRPITAVATVMSYQHLIGRSLSGPDGPVTPGPGVILFLSAGSPASDRILRELASPDRTDVVAVAWVDEIHAPVAAWRAPPGVTVLDDGPTVAVRLGVRITPFAVMIGPHGVVEAAAPIGGVGQVRSRTSDRSRRRLDVLAPTG